MERSRLSPWVRIAVVVLLAGQAGCSSISVSRSPAPDLLDSWRSSITLENRLSPRSQQTLRRLDLAKTYDHDPDEAANRLHALAQKDPHPDFLFALSEMHYLQGRKIERYHCQDSIGHYYLCAGYAYHYLFATADSNSTMSSDGQPRPSALLAPTNAFDPRFRLACDLYNRGLAKCIAAAHRVGRLDPRSQLHIPTTAGRDFTLSVVHHGFNWKPEEFGSFLFCEDFKVEGLDNQYESYGLGVPLIVRRAKSAALPSGTRYPEGVCFPVTAFFRFDGTLADLTGRRAGELEFFNPLAIQSVAVRGRTIPLQTDLTTPLAYLLSGTGLDYLGYYAFLRPEKLQSQEGIYMLEPYQPGKIPVLMIHGLLSSPITWAPLFNDLRAEPALRDRYQFWFYFYPSANPYLSTAADLRKNLENLRKRVDPQKKDASFDQMVLVGHSMGGLIARLLTVDSKDDFWRQVSDRPFNQIPVQPDTAEELQRCFFFEREPCVRRVIFLATPHHGSKLSPSALGQLAARLVQMPATLMKVAKDVADDKADLHLGRAEEGIPTSVDLLDPKSPALEVLAAKPLPANVQFHSIVGVVPVSQAPVERWLGGTSHEVGDSVVSYASAHLDGVASELVVPADHMHIHHHPLAGLEVRRILLEHLQSLQVILPVAHVEPGR